MKQRTLSRMFWLVWNETVGLPRHKHWTLDEARKEAARLAQQHPGQHFHVLALLGTTAFQAVIWSEPDMSLEDEIQF